MKKIGFYALFILVLVGCSKTTNPTSSSTTETTTTTVSTTQQTTKKADGLKSFTKEYVPLPVKLNGENYKIPKELSDYIGYYSGTGKINDSTVTINFALTKDGYYTVFKETQYFNETLNMQRTTNHLATGILEKKFNGFVMHDIVGNARQNYPTVSENLVPFRDESGKTIDLMPVTWYPNQRLYENDNNLSAKENYIVVTLDNPYRSQYNIKSNQNHEIRLVITDNKTLSIDGIALNKVNTAPKMVENSAFQYFYKKIEQFAHMRIETEQDFENYVFAMTGGSQQVLKEHRLKTARTLGDGKNYVQLENEIKGKKAYLKNGAEINIKFAIFSSTDYVSDGNNVYEIISNRDDDIIKINLITPYNILIYRALQED